jgi:hypothetical protein
MFFRSRDPSPGRKGNDCRHFAVVTIILVVSFFFVVVVVVVDVA